MQEIGQLWCVLSWCRLTFMITIFPRIITNTRPKKWQKLSRVRENWHWQSFELHLSRPPIWDHSLLQPLRMWLDSDFFAVACAEKLTSLASKWAITHQNLCTDRAFARFQSRRIFSVKNACLDRRFTKMVTSYYMLLNRKRRATTNSALKRSHRVLKSGCMLLALRFF